GRGTTSLCCRRPFYRVNQSPRTKRSTSPWPLPPDWFSHWPWHFYWTTSISRSRATTISRRGSDWYRLGTSRSSSRARDSVANCSLLTPNLTRLRRIEPFELAFSFQGSTATSKNWSSHQRSREKESHEPRPI